MTYLVDSDWVADYLKGKEAARTLLTELFPSGLSISIITYAEVYEGVYYGHDRARHEAGFRRFVAGVGIVGISRRVARRFAVIRGELRRQSNLISQTDLLIAATALEHEMILLTRNRRDFARIPDLTLDTGTR